MSAVDVEGLTVRFGDRTVVDGVSFAVGAGERWGIIGESGSGKSLTAAVVAGLAPHRATVSGSVRVGGVELVGARERVLAGVRGRGVAMMLQDSSVALNPLVRVGSQVARPLRALHGYSRAAARDEVRRLLDRVGLDDPATARVHPTMLSGGQRQRVCLAMALACRARVLVADEPTTALDPSVARDILTLIDDEVTGTLLFVSHDLAVVAQVCTDVLVLRAGRVVECGTVADIVTAPQEEYTRELVAAARLLAPRGGR